MPYKDPERQRAYALAWLKRNPEKARAATTRWKQRNPEKVRAMKRTQYARDPQKHNAAMAEWHRRHPEVVRAKSQKYRARKMRAAGSYTASQWLALLAVTGNCCAYCGATGPIQAEHRVPLSRGGTNSIDNIVPSCAKCNLRKHRLTDNEFRARLESEKDDPRLHEPLGAGWAVESRFSTID